MQKPVKFFEVPQEIYRLLYVRQVPVQLYLILYSVLKFSVPYLHVLASSIL